jgi:hypothetical protein
MEGRQGRGRGRGLGTTHQRTTFGPNCEPQEGFLPGIKTLPQPNPCEETPRIREKVVRGRGQEKRRGLGNDASAGLKLLPARLAGDGLRSLGRRILELETQHADVKGPRVERVDPMKVCDNAQGTKRKHQALGEAKIDVEYEIAGKYENSKGPLWPGRKTSSISPSPARSNRRISPASLP